MKVVVQHDEKMESYLQQYAMHIKYISPSYKIIDIEEKYLSWLSEITQYIEPNFVIRLCEEKCISESPLNNSEIILASIGCKDTNKRVDSYYNMKTHTLEQPGKMRGNTACERINCYSKSNEISAVEYITCICYLRDLARGYHKPIVIYANLYVPDETYRYRSLTYKIISNYLSDLEGVLITKTCKESIYKHYAPSQETYEFYLDHTIYLEDNLNSAVKRIIPFLYTSQDQSRFKNVYRDCRQNNLLYRNNVFYEAISPDQEIYVVLTLGEFRRPADYQALGIHHIPLIGDYGMLYAKRSVFDELGEMLRLEVEHPYYIPILSHPFCDKETINQGFAYDITGENLAYKGEGVYIGVITTDHVDYSNMALRMPGGKSRIAYIWEQVWADEGIDFSTEQIDAALSSPEPGQIIKLPAGDSVSTMILALAGGESEVPRYRGVATESEFVVAKINTAPEAMQRINGGMPSENAVTMADILIGVLKLVNFARQEGKPLVLCLPFNTNIDSHDGSLIFYEILGLIASRERVTIIVPVGEEADKQHHYSMVGTQPAFATVDLNVQKENQNVVAIGYQHLSNIITVTLYPPMAVATQSINLKTVGVTQLMGAVIYSNGYQISPLNGAARLFFRIENPRVGTWRILFELDTQLSSPIDLWISQQELNRYITLSPANPFITIGSLACLDNLIAIGGYDQDNRVVLRSSGRGYTWDSRVKPHLAANGNAMIAPSGVGEWVRVKGTLPAASVMAGVAATIYNKYSEKQVFPLPNTLVMRSILLGGIRQWEGAEYPNPSEGNGIFDMEKLNALLTESLLL